MVYSNPLYQPSLLELAQQGNCRALTYWINSFLGPEGVEVQVQPAPNQFLKVVVYFRRPLQREACLQLRDRLVRTICYRLWTLNSQAIRGVRIIAYLLGDSKVLWHTTVRINSPAAFKLRQAEIMNLRQMQAANQFKFRVVRSLFMSGITLAGFFAGYWLFYLQVGRFLAKGNPTESPGSGNSPEAIAGTDAVSAPSQPQNIGQNSVAVPKEFRGQVVSQIEIPNAEKVIALTFDDGPNSAVTAQVLAILKQYNAKATFFMSGANVEQNPDVAKQVAAEGHAIGNRGWSRWIGTGSAADPKREVDETSRLIQEKTGMKPELFRPVDGQLDNQVVAYAKEQQYAVTLWSVDAQDQLVAAPILLDNVLRNAQPGRIVLLHDSLGMNNQAATLQALPQLITALQQQGYRFVTVPQLLAMQKSGRQQDTKVPLRKPAIATASAEAPALTSPQSAQVRLMP